VERYRRIANARGVRRAGAAQNDRPPFRQKPAVTATWQAKRTWIASGAAWVLAPWHGVVTRETFCGHRV